LALRCLRRRRGLRVGRLTHSSLLTKEFKHRFKRNARALCKRGNLLLGEPLRIRSRPCIRCLPAPPCHCRDRRRRFLLLPCKKRWLPVAEDLHSRRPVSERKHIRAIVPAFLLSPHDARHERRDTYLQAIVLVEAPISSEF